MFNSEMVWWLLIGMNVVPFVYLAVAVLLVLRNGAKYGVQAQGAATITGREEDENASAIEGREPMHNGRNKGCQLEGQQVVLKCQVSCTWRVREWRGQTS